jgi:alkyl sulfatase BDS1-like metallo-beta-lactamase superfamily hydrolase
MRPGACTPRRAGARGASANTEPKAASTTIQEQQEALLKTLPMTDEQDFADARRGFLGAVQPAVLEADDGRVIWDGDSYAFLTGDAPVSVNPSLWRQSRLNAVQGLFEVVPGVYQVRGLDLSNITFVEGERGVLVVDPLIFAETAAAALACTAVTGAIAPSRA